GGISASRPSGSRLAEDPVDRGTAHRAFALGHLHAGPRDRHAALEVPLLPALDAVAVVGLGHDVPPHARVSPYGYPALGSDKQRSAGTRWLIGVKGTNPARPRGIFPAYRQKSIIVASLIRSGSCGK